MTTYDVSASVTFIGWVSVEADSPEEAFELAQSASASSFEYDSATAEVEFNVEPAVESR